MLLMVYVKANKVTKWWPGAIHTCTLDYIACHFTSCVQSVSKLTVCYISFWTIFHEYIASLIVFIYIVLDYIYRILYMFLNQIVDELYISLYLSIVWESFYSGILDKNILVTFNLLHIYKCWHKLWVVIRFKGRYFINWHVNLLSDL